jgi:hypothetical protein
VSRDSEVRVEVGGALVCPRCFGDAYLSARVPHRMELSDGGTVRGYRTVVLCPDCDRDNPNAGGVLAFFAMHERIDPGTVQEAAPLIEEWVQRSAGEVYTDDELAEDIRLWESGDM